jgi:ferredoxin
MRRGKRMAIHVKADRNLCIGAGQCLLASGLFELDGDGKVYVHKDGVVSVEELEAVQDAVALCPVEALTLEQDEE